MKWDWNFLCDRQLCRLFQGSICDLAMPWLRYLPRWSIQKKSIYYRYLQHYLLISIQVSFSLSSLSIWLAQHPVRAPVFRQSLPSSDSFDQVDHCNQGCLVPTASQPRYQGSFSGIYWTVTPVLVQACVLGVEESSVLSMDCYANGAPWDQMGDLYLWEKISYILDDFSSSVIAWSWDTRLVTCYFLGLPDMFASWGSFNCHVASYQWTWNISFVTNISGAARQRKQTITSYYYNKWHPRIIQLYVSMLQEG